MMIGATNYGFQIMKVVLRVLLGGGEQLKIDKEAST
jgi:hypothetical protein